MQLILDMGNSTIVAALMTNGEITHSARIPSSRQKPQEFFEEELSKLMAHADGADVERCALSSVVPELNERLCAAAEAVTNAPVTVITTEMIQQMLTLDVDEPSAVGKDRLCDCIGALSLDVINGTEWAVVIDMGTATTVNVISCSSTGCTFHGGMIIPGVRTSLLSLSNKASQLNEVRIEAPEHIIGRNTTQCMQSGIVYGHAAMIDGIIERIAEEFNTTNLSIVATGGMAKKIIPHCRHEIHYDEHLLLKGLYRIVNLI